MKIGTTLSVNDSQDTPKEWLKMVVSRFNFKFLDLFRTMDES